MDRPAESTRPGLILLCGSGGVGKTTIAASLALYGALSGGNILAFTIDPARRLADALGLKPSGGEIQDVPLGKTRSHGQLRTAMLDVEQAVEEMVDRYCDSPSTARKIKSNRIFRTAVDAMTGAEEYIALGKVLQILIDEDIDYLVVDTAPTHYALNFFHGPEKLISALDPDRIRRIIQPLLKIRDSGQFNPGTRIGVLLNQIIESILGVGLLHELGDLAGSLETMFEGFRDRVYQIHRILRDTRRTAIVGVSSPDIGPLEDMVEIVNSLDKSGMKIQGIILNRVIRLNGKLQIGNIPDSSEEPDDPVTDPRIADIVRLSKRACQELQIRSSFERKRIDDVLSRLPGTIPVVELPLQAGEIRSLNDLKVFHPDIGRLADRLLRMK
ncbi:ArsA family ATPase [bacterium]|nr:ArsA family ATPase [candidate division CSSED10-310 bacterium]